MGMPYHMNTMEIKNLEITDLEEQNVINLPTMYTKDEMPVSQEHIPTTEDMQRWPHLCDIELPKINADIGLLLGNNVPDLTAPIEIRVGSRGTPYAARSLMGWIPWNVLRDKSPQPLTVNRADVQVIERLCEAQDLNELYLASLQLDFPERLINDKRENSVEDKLFVQKLTDSKKKVGDHYEFCLPFKDDHLCLPDNRRQALNRLQSLKQKFQGNQQFYEDYCKFMQMLLEKDFAEIVPEEELNRSDQRVWYLPHHGVYNPNKPSKIRVVFDSSAKSANISLNSKLLKGPDLTNSLVGVLIKFRQEPFAAMGDVEKMFYQVHVAKEDRDCLRFYWWPDGELNERPNVYRMTVHIFGAVSSPSCASFALRQTIYDHQEEYDPRVVQAALENFYVDDFLCSMSTEDDVILLVQGIMKILKNGGFRVTKWLSNSRVVLGSIPEAERASGFANLDLESLPSERALGVFWHVEEDTLGFIVKPRDCPMTRRNLLSILSSIYDPLGLVSPVILPARVIFQEITKEGVDWDVELEGAVLQKWSNWIENLTLLNRLSIPRCLKPHNLQDIQGIEMHHFADASEIGYGTVTYIRLETVSGQVHCSLLMGKSRVAPLQKMTIPRMELTAATMAVRLNKFLSDQLQYQLTATYYWTDSTAVLRYIWNMTSRFQTFIANRLAIIHDGSDISQWKFVDGQSNPADIASRGLDLSKQQDVKLWTDGPEFLRQPESQWPTMPDNVKCNDIKDLEAKKSSNVAKTTDSTENDVLENMMAQYSDLNKVVRVLGWVLKFVRCLRHQIQHPETRIKKSSTGELKADAFLLPNEYAQEAETLLIKHSQMHSFETEIADLKADGKVRPSSRIAKLDPFVAEDIIRVGGRLARSSLPEESKHQILVPQKSPFATLLLRRIHKTVGHLGRASMLAELRQRFWIPHASTLIKGLVSKCVICRKYQARRHQQKMADLPPQRVTSDVPPFAHVGMDYFGPLEVKRGRTVHKRYGVIFTCSASRAVHLEVAHSLDTDSCVNAIRRFLARRGPVQSIRSDNGTNLVGAEREMKVEIQNWNHSKVNQTLQQQGIRWEFNPPSASNFGGFWERLIRSVRKVFHSLLKEHFVRLDEEGLHTVMCEVEQILNNRPLTASSDDPNDLNVLTPSHLLLMKPSVCLSPGLFSETDSYVKRRWRHVQHVANVFWSRWRREYLPQLQERQKWLQPKENLAVGDIVLISDNVPRNVWPMARITELHPDRNGVVRVVTVKTRTSTLKRPVNKLCRVLETDSN